MASNLDITTLFATLSSLGEPVGRIPLPEYHETDLKPTEAEQAKRQAAAQAKRERRKKRNLL